MPIGFAGNEGIVGDLPEQSGRSGRWAGSNSFYLEMNPFFSARALNRGFSGKRNTAKRMMLDESIGLKSDFTMARKITGTTLLGRVYSAGLSRAPESVRAFAPTLAHISPSRHLNMLNLYAGGSPEGMLRGVGTNSISMADMIANVGKYDAPAAATGRVRGMMGNTFRKVLGSELSGEYGWDYLSGASKGEDLAGLLRASQSKIRGAYAAGDTAGIRAGQYATSTALHGTEKAGADILTRKLASKMVGKVGGKVALRVGAALGVNVIPVAGQIISIAMWAQMGVDAAKWGTKAAYKGLMNVGGMVGEDWKRGMFQTSSVSPFVGGTQRQRALQVMQQTGLQLSSALGNEAQYF